MTAAFSRTGPYAALNAYLSGRYADNLVLTFAQIEDLLGFALPPEARVREEWWSSDTADGPSPQARAWTQANRTASANLFARTVRFERATA
jgi:hypothetical protein